MQKSPQNGHDHDQRLLTASDSRQRPTPYAALEHLLPINFDFDKFGKQFLSHYFTRGFGNLSKKEIELQLFTQLCEAGIFTGGGTNRLQQASVFLRIPITRVRGLTYEMQLRSGVVNNKDWFRTKLLNAIATTQYRQSDEKIAFGVEDPMLRAEIEGRLKLEGRFPDYGMSREILHIGIDDFSFLLEIILEPEEREAILKAVPNSKTKADQTTLFNEAMRTFIVAAANGAGDELGRGGIKIVFSFLTGGISSIADAISAQFKT